MGTIEHKLIILACAGMGIREAVAFVVTDGQTTAEIANRVGSANHTMATRLNTLAKKGLIERAHYDGAARWVKTDLGYDVMNRAGL